MFMHQISASLSRHKLNLGLMLAGRPLCARSERERGTTGGTERERARERARVERERYSDFLHRLCGPGRLFLCVFLSPLQKQDERRLCYPQPEGYAEPIYLSPLCSTLNNNAYYF